MDAPKALLIQDVSDYISVLKNALQSLLWILERNALTAEDMIEWIIKEEIELVYSLSTDDQSQRQAARHVYDHVKNYLNGTLSIYTSTYIKAPRLYSDNRQISIKLVGRDLYLWYYR